MPAYGLQTAADVLIAATRSVPAVTVDVSATSVVADARPRACHRLLDELAPAVVFANAAEAAAAGLLDGAPWPVVVKRGPDPAWILCDGRRVEVPAAAVGDVRDTTGAGDAFAGGFLTAFVAGADLGRRLPRRAQGGSLGPDHGRRRSLTSGCRRFDQQQGSRR